MRFEYTITYVPGKKLHTPDTLSRAPVDNQLDSLTKLSAKEIELFIHTLCHLAKIDYKLTAVLKLVMMFVPH